MEINSLSECSWYTIKAVHYMAFASLNQELVKSFSLRVLR